MRALFLTAVCCGLSLADDPKPVSDRAKQQVAAELVDKLGSHDFRERDEAEKKLVAMGGVAFDEVKAGLSSKTAEVAERCGRLLPQLRAAKLRAPDSPAWKRFAQVAGDTDGAKELFGTMAKEPVLADWLEQIEADPKEAAKAYQRAVDELDGWWVERKGRIPARAFPNVWVTFMVYAGGLDGAGKVTGPSSKPLPADVEAAVQTALRTVMTAGLWSGGPKTVEEAEKGKTPAVAMRAMFGRWLATQTAEPLVSAGLSVATETKLTEALSAVTRHAKDESHSTIFRVRCVGVAAFLGGDPMPLAEPLLTETAEITRQPQPARLSVQVRDVAAGLVVRSRGFQLADFGYEYFPWPWYLKPQEEPRMWSLWPRGVVGFGFADEASREKVHAIVAAFLAIKPLPVCAIYGKVVVPLADPPELLAAIAQIETVVRTSPTPISAYVLAADFNALSDQYPRHRERIRYERMRMELAYPDRLKDRLPITEPQLLAIDDLLCRVDLRRRLAEREALLSNRQIAAGHLLTAYAELHPLELPEKRPEVPKGNPLAPTATAKERAAFAVANTLHRDAQYVCDLLDARDGVVRQLRELFKVDPDELKPLAEKKLSKEAAEALMKQIK